VSWVKLDDAFPRHPKVLPLAPGPKWAYVEALCYCGQYLTDGALPVGIISAKDAAALVGAGLLDACDDGGFIVHDYLEYNPSRESVQSKSKSNRKAARMRWAEIVQSESHSEMQSESHASRMHDALGAGSGTGDVGLEVQKQGVGFDAFWSAYPRKVGKVKARERWDAALAAGADPAAIVAAAVAYRDDPHRDPDYTAHPTTWLNQGRWLDDLRRGPKVSATTQRLVATADRLEAEGR
jgi:hypothetical protein